MGQIRDRMAADLAIAAYSVETRTIYLRHARQFVAHFVRPPTEMGEDEIANLVRPRLTEALRALLTAAGYNEYPEFLSDSPPAEQGGGGNR